MDVLGNIMGTKKDTKKSAKTISFKNNFKGMEQFNFGTMEKYTGKLPGMLKTSTPKVKASKHSPTSMPKINIQVPRMRPNFNSNNVSFNSPIRRDRYAHNELTNTEAQKLLPGIGEALARGQVIDAVTMGEIKPYIRVGATQQALNPNTGEIVNARLSKGTGYIGPGDRAASSGGSTTNNYSTTNIFGEERRPLTPAEQAELDSDNKIASAHAMAKALLLKDAYGNYVHPVPKEGASYWNNETGGYQNISIGPDGQRMGSSSMYSTEELNAMNAPKLAAQKAAAEAQAAIDAKTAADLKLSSLFRNPLLPDTRQSTAFPDTRSSSSNRSSSGSNGYSSAFGNYTDILKSEQPKVEQPKTITPPKTIVIPSSESFLPKPGGTALENISAIDKAAGSGISRPPSSGPLIIAPAPVQSPSFFQNIGTGLSNAWKSVKSWF